MNVIAEADGLSITLDGEEIAVQRLEQGGVRFATKTGRMYHFRPIRS
ncbi:hypothetical protein RB620_03605 [Paenibacillus sp. LHD-117]|nr:hypothetical protein [Paenibacillus sp. LHD-117]MDQ6418516.1 hypothetical protein [Paenibacillus sp. LHD-117]